MIDTCQKVPHVWKRCGQHWSRRTCRRNGVDEILTVRRRWEMYTTDGPRYRFKHRCTP
jgi:hypothetical protein